MRSLAPAAAPREGNVPMIRRLILTATAAFFLCGIVAVRPGLAAQDPRPSPNPTAPAGPSGTLLPPPEPPRETEDEPKTKPKSPAPTPKKQEDEPPRDPFTPSGGLEPVPEGPAPEAKTDEDLLRVQTSPTGDTGPLPAAKEPLGGVPASGTAPTPDARLLPIDRLPLEPSTASLTVEVKAPPTANLNRPLKFKIYIKNSGQSPAMGVMVYDRMPEGLEFEKSDPPPNERMGDILIWQLESIPAGTEKTLTVTAVPRKVGDFDHAPTVTLRTGSRSRTLVKHPKIKVEVMQESSEKVLKGGVVQLSIRVTNNGTGPARNVVLHANLTPGLAHESGTAIEVAFKDYLGIDALGPGDTKTIPLELDATSGGDQVCKLYAESPDVEESPDAKAEAKVTVVEPKLVLELKGSSERYTDTVGSYVLTVSNPGTATAKNVLAAAFLPNISGKLVDRSPPEVKYVAQKRMLSWAVGELEPGAKKEMKFNVQLGGVGIFKVEAAAEAKGSCPRQEGEFSTQVVGMPDVKCQVVAQTKILDVGEENTYEVHLSNKGSKEATNLLVSAVVENLQIEKTGGTQIDAKSTDKDFHDAVFPPLTLAPGAEQTLWIKVKATKPGKAKCTVTVVHDDSSTETSTTTKVREPK